MSRREKINAKKASEAEAREEKEEGGENISYVFGEEVVLDLTFPLAH